MLHRDHKFAIIGLMEPFQGVDQILKYKMKLGMKNANYIRNGKIWIYIQDFIKVTVISDIEPRLSLNLDFLETIIN